MTLPLVAEEEEPPTSRELNPGAICAISLPHYDRRGQTEFHHLSAGPTCLLNPGWAQASNRSIPELPAPPRFYQVPEAREAVAFTA
jgi:hypothetical protein